VSIYSAIVTWQRGSAKFTDNRFSRAHVWQFDGGALVKASASPQVVRPPLSDESAVDPEEAFVASLASCHMLWFLALAAKQGYEIESYRDEAEGVLSKGPDGKLWMTSVALKPHAVFAGAKAPTSEEFHALHHRAHEECFIANSVKTEVTTSPTFEVSE
jgi:organic hydroperoxide reductase OsmC/OhrA